MRNKAVTRQFYTEHLSFRDISAADYAGYLILERDGFELHFLEHLQLDPLRNDGQVYLRVEEIEQLYEAAQQQGCPIHPNGVLSKKPWGQMEFSVLDPDHNLLTFGEAII